MNEAQNTLESTAEILLGNEAKRRWAHLQETGYKHGGEHIAASLFQTASTCCFNGSRILRQIVGHRIFLENERREFGGRLQVLIDNRYALREFVGFVIRTGLVTLSPKPAQ